MKRLIAILVSLLLTVTAAASCGAKEPDISTLKDELTTLIESSYEVNEIFFGKGLPTYERGGEYDREYHLYNEDDTEFALYEYVIQESDYYFTEQIKWKAEAVYTKDYLEGVYTMAFDGYADENTGAVTTARYLDANSWLMKYAYGENDPFDHLNGKKRRYDFDTMTAVKPYSSDYLNISIDSYLEGEEGNRLNIILHFKKTADGWRLDSPTY